MNSRHVFVLFFFLMERRPPRSTQSRSSAASDVYKRQLLGWSNGGVLALAVARLLEQGGDSVAFLGLLDTQPDQAVSAAGDATPVEELMTYIRRDRRGDFESIPQHEREALQQHLASLADDNRLEYAIQWARERNFLSDEEAEASIGSLKLGYALAREAARFVTVTRFNPIQARIHVWGTTSTLALEASGGMPRASFVRSAFFASSSFTPKHERRSTTAARRRSSFSPAPAVKVRVSRPFMMAA